MLGNCWGTLSPARVSGLRHSRAPGRERTYLTCHKPSRSPSWGICEVRWLRVAPIYGVPESTLQKLQSLVTCLTPTPTQVSANRPPTPAGLSSSCLQYSFRTRRSRRSSRKDGGPAPLPQRPTGTRFRIRPRHPSPRLRLVRHAQARAHSLANITQMPKPGRNATRSGPHMATWSLLGARHGSFEVRLPICPSSTVLLVYLALFSGWLYDRLA
jgi:hypothetical protein